jgi:uncharacterized protein YehS (DUF1456 family)
MFGARIWRFFMINNDIYRRLRYLFGYQYEHVVALFAATGFEVTEAEYKGWACTEDEERFILMSDRELAIFLNGIIIDRRGKQDGPTPVPEEQMSNNVILRKLKIAFDMRSEDMMEVFGLVDRKLSPHELSAFFRKPTHKSFRYVKGQYLRNFLMGLQLKYKSSIAKRTP